MKDWETVVGCGLGFLLGMVIVLSLSAGMLLLIAFPVQWAWNLTLPAIFNFPAIDYWQAFGISLLIAVLGRLLIPASGKSRA